ncbi:cytochrome P450 [Paractinoplanes toevensis]|nr:cytochrome P450 [Actinoplanes toevensis]
MALGTKESAAPRGVDDLAWMDVDDPLLAEDPAAFLAAHRAADWAFRSRRGLEILRYDQVWRFLTDRRLVPDVADLKAVAGLGDTAPGATGLSGMLSVHGRDHTRLRGAAAAWFAPARVEQWLPFIRDTCRELIGDPAPGTVIDLVTALCVPLPGLVFTRMVGAPAADAARLCAWSDSLLKVFLQDPAHRDEIIEAGRGLEAYVLSLIEERRADPGDDLLSAMLGRHEAGALTDEELTGVAAELLSASTDNTASQLGVTLMHTLADPARWQRLAADPALAAGAAVEAERLTPRVGYINRKALTDTVIDGLAVPAGTWVRCSVLSGHHDETVFASPLDFDPGRADQRRSLVFGGGPHYCIGAGLAQVEIEEALRYLAARYPGLRPAGPPGWIQSEVLMSLASLPVRIPEENRA